MIKIWKPTEPKSDKLILIKNECIYKGNPNFEELNKISQDFSNVSEIKGLFSIPYSYIKKIENQSGKNYIKIFLSPDVEEHLNIYDERLKNEIFSFLRKELMFFKYKIEKPSFLKYTKPQLFGILLLTLIYISTMYFAIQLANGYSFELHNSRVGGIIGMLILLAENGYLKLTLWYSIILGLVVFTLIKKNKSRSEVQTLTR